MHVFCQMEVFEIQAADIRRRFMKRVIPDRNCFSRLDWAVSAMMRSCDPKDLASIHEYAIKTYEAMRTKLARRCRALETNAA